MRKLWGRANSSNVMKVLWLLDELSLPYERIDVGGPFGGTHDAEYVAMNPNSAVPTLQEGAFSLWESNVILRYLAGVHAPGAPIWPDDPQARANVDRWMDWQQTIMNAPGTIVFQGLVRTPPDKQDKAAIAAAFERLGRAWGLLDRQLAQHPFVAGPDFTLADIASGGACASLVLFRRCATGPAQPAGLVRPPAGTAGVSETLCHADDLTACTLDRAAPPAPRWASATAPPY